MSSDCYIGSSVDKGKLQKMKDAGVLIADEELLAAVWGKIESSRIPFGGARSKEMEMLPILNSRSGLLGLTTQRVVFYMPKMMSRYEFEAHEIDQIDSVTFNKGMRKGRIDLRTHNGNKVIKSIDNEEGRTIVERIQTAIQENKQNSKTVASTTQAQNPMDILKTQYVNGEITEEEFEKKKKIIEG